MNVVHGNFKSHHNPKRPYAQEIESFTIFNRRLQKTKSNEKGKTSQRKMTLTINDGSVSTMQTSRKTKTAKLINPHPPKQIRQKAFHTSSLQRSSETTETVDIN